MPKEINLPDEHTPPPFENQLRGALYDAANYYTITKITHMHRVAYLVPKYTYDRLRAEATQRLAEIQGHGCEAESARAFEQGRLSALDDLDWRQQSS
jgi:hypothetical protein